MGKRLNQQTRGKGTPKYVAKSHRYKVKPKHRDYDDSEKTVFVRGEVISFIDDPARNSIVAQVRLEDGKDHYIIASEGLAIGDEVYFGAQAKITLGSSLPLYSIPDGFYVYNIEKIPGDGGKFARSGGSYGIVVAREKSKGKVYIRLPSKRIVEFEEECRAQIGVAAGGGIKEKPLLKAGNAYHKYRAKNKPWPKVRGVKMSPYDHPFGGKQHHEGKPTTVSKHAPPGAKVGHIAAKHTGRKERKSKSKNE